MRGTGEFSTGSARRGQTPPGPILWKTLPSPSVWRRRFYEQPGRQRRLARPVISVGNLSFGGRGKSPTVVSIARLLVAAGERPAVLSRGYGRARPEPGVVVVSDGAHLLADVARAGDEPLMIARDAPGALVLVADERALAGALAERALGATVHLLDDGFQHLQLARDVDIVLVAPADLRGRPVPFGRLREPVSALRSADAILIDDRRTRAADGRLEARLGLDDAGLRAAVFTLRRTLGPVTPLEPERPWPGRSRPVVAVAGIADPGRFARALDAAGWSVAETLVYPDHHRFTRADLDRMAASLRQRDAAAIVTTAKDAVRLRPLRPFPVQIGCVPLDVDIEPADRFRDWLLGSLERVRS